MHNKSKMLANKFIIVDYLHTLYTCLGHSQKDTLTKRVKLPPAGGINPWQSTIYQHQLKQHYKLPEPLKKNEKPR